MEQTIQEQVYTSDILGGNFQQTTLEFPNDFEGKVVATLIRKLSGSPSDKAVLYIHGFNDYYFQVEMAEKFNQKGFDFYALDLRKYGRSWLPNQKFNNVRDLQEYDAEINKALEIIEEEQHTKVLLAGHSTGGLILTSFAGRTKNPIVKGLWCNSPFYDFNLDIISKTIGIPLISRIGKNNPVKKMKGGFSPFYGLALHKIYSGEWDYSLDWKPNVAPEVSYGFVRAVFLEQQEIKAGIKINVPVLVMHAARSANPKEMNEDVYTTDIILDQKDIDKNARKIQGNVTIQPIQNGIHDLVLSKKEVRENVYQKLFDWLKKI
ncbi:alpha/beta hydrolase [Chryseobacterium gleum]|uniref:alpha/beta hydrolase n=1 Tax=Chryseobacterium gleum TaxID=250 RepID=UPI00241EB48C|nr:alpha/beta hydrolase [Chryseobacterium gleum]